jgi:hypothetical protein
MSEPSEASRHVPRDMVLFPRRLLYYQALVGVGLAAAAFALGYWIGSGNATPERPNAAAAPGQQRVWVEGRLSYSPQAGQDVADADAVIVVLPAGESPLRPLAVEGLRPQDPPPADSQPGLQAIRQLGGAYTRARASGEFSLVVPQPGKYHVLIVSRHAVRSAGSPIREVDLIEMNRYFQSAAALIATAQYRWTTEAIDAGSHPLELHFNHEERGAASE